jgi:hypothetical protein
MSVGRSLPEADISLTREPQAGNSALPRVSNAMIGVHSNVDDVLRLLLTRYTAVDA